MRGYPLSSLIWYNKSIQCKGLIEMSAVSSVFKREYHIDLRDVDFKRRLKFSTLFSYFQDIGSLASEDLGFGIETLRENFGVTWILTRMRVNIIRHPGLNEDITIETWAL